MGQRPDEIERLDPMTGRGADPVGAPDPGSFGPESTSAGLPASESPTGGYATDISWGAPADTGGAYAGPADDGAGVTDADDEIGATRAQIEQTRANMSETIDAIQEKLSPSNLVQGAKDSVREATIGKASQMVSDAGDTVQEAVSRAGDTARGFGSTVVETIRQNPIPAALAGLGLGWLFWSGRKQSSTSGYRAYSYERPYGYNRQYDYGYTPYRGAGSAYGSGYQPSAYGGQQQYGADYQGQDRSAAGQAAERVQGAVGQAQDMAGHVADQTQNVAGQVQDAAGQMANQVQGTAGQVAGQVQDTAQQLGYQAQYQTQRAVSGFQQMLDERPLAVAAGAVALGLAVGLAIPSTPQEDRLMGEARDNLVQQAQQTAQDTAQKVQSVAQEAVGAAKSEAHEQFSQGS